MSIPAGIAERASGGIASLVELAKPRVTLFVVVTAGVGLLVAPGRPEAAPAILFLAATFLLAASANTLNCWLERETDSLMIRTRGRALPTGRLSPRAALAAGVVEVVAALPLLAMAGNLRVALLGAVAHFTYVALYTPLKRSSPMSILVGAVPGAIPPLMGWTAATGALGAPGFALFGILWFWQVPHSIAIALRLEDDYRRGGIRAIPIASGGGTARRTLLASVVLLAAWTFLAVPLGLAGAFYLTSAALLGAGFIALAWRGVRRGGGEAWAVATFRFSLVYLTMLLGALLAETR